MGQIAIGIAGGAIGSLYGNPMLGFSAGMALGGLLFPTQTNPAPQDRMVQGSDYGAAIPIVFGQWRLAGNIIWAAPLLQGPGTSTGGGSGGGNSTATYLLDATMMICEGPVTILKAWADSDLLADYTGGSPIYSKLINSSTFVIHPGYSDPGTINTSQLPDATIVSYNGATATPAYTNRATVTVNNFPWSTYGHTPNFTFLVQESINPTLQYILTKLFLRVGVPSGSIDFSALSGITVSGFMIPGRMDLASAIKPLMDAYHFDVVEVDGIIKGSLKSASPSFTLSPQWVGVSTDGDAPEVPIEPSRKSETDLPLSVDVTFVSPGRDYQPANQTVRRFVVQSQNQDTLSLPIVMSDTTARQTGESYLYEKWNQRRGYKITYTPDYLFIAPGDSGYLTVNGQTRTIRIVEQTVGMFGHIEATAVEHEPTIYTQIAPGDGFGSGSITPGTGTLAGYVLDVNAPTDDTVFTSTGIEQDLLGVCLGRTGATWRGGFFAIGTAPVYSPYGGRMGNGANHIQFPNMSTFGVTSAALASASKDVIDTTSSLTIVMNAGTLSSCSDDDFLTGSRNLALIGSEYVQFRDVTLVSAGIYTISHLIRGRRGTEWAIGGHTSSEAFIFVNNYLGFWGTQASRITSPAQTGNFGGYEDNIDTGTSTQITNQPMTGANLMCYSPCNIAATRDGSNNITLTWNRRSRISGANPWTVGLETKDSTGQPFEEYVVDVLVGASVVHSYTVIAQLKGVTYMSTPSLVISAADQTAYCGGIQNPISVNVYQLNYFMPVNGGRGYAGSASV